MLSPESVLHRRFANRRPGLELIAIEDAALPVTLVNAEVLAQERKPLPLLHEFVLRLAHAGVRTRDESARVLGIDEPLLAAAVVDQVAADNLRYTSATGEVQLTDRGLEAVRTHESVRPVHVPIVVPFDRLTWQVAHYPRADLVTKAEARDTGLLILPALRSTRISIEDLPVGAVNAWLRRSSGPNSRRQVLRVQRISPSTHRYLPVRLLVYAESARGEVEVSVVVDGDASDAHDEGLQACGGAATLGISIDPSTSRPPIDAALEERRVSDAEVAQLRAATVEGRLAAAEQKASSISDPEPTSSEEEALARIEVRSVSVFEHRDLLRQALDTAQRRLLIISPWIRSAVVDRAFAARLDTCLRRGVRTTIAYGIGRDDRQSDAEAIERLAELERDHSGFAFVRLRNTHAKVLVFDDNWISTSFNWLSFKGDPDRTYRMEEGTLVRIPGQVTAQYEAYLALVNEQRRPDSDV